MDQRWGVVDPVWYWRDNASGTSFNRPAYQDLLDFCRQKPGT
jgi:DNA invertase Pin-like site-specific DNA recombinase